MLRAVGQAREDVFICNVLKCRPPQNRDPLPEETAHCLPFLRQQLALLKPRVIVAVGRIAAQNILSTQASLSNLRGQTHDYAGIPLIVTYHPAYLLRSPREKAKAWQDLMTARRIHDRQDA
jgi:DNA polymerase